MFSRLFNGDDWGIYVKVFTMITGTEANKCFSISIEVH